MKIVFKKTRYYYWLFSGFFKKYARVMISVFVIAFFSLFFLRSIKDSLYYFFNLNKINVGLVPFTRERMPLEVLQKISLPIVAYDSKGSFVKGLSNKWQILEDGKVYEFRFPKALNWADNSPFSAHEIDFESFGLRDVTIETASDNLLRFRLKEPLANFPALLTVPVVKAGFVGIKGDYKISRVKYEFGEIVSVTLLPLKRNLPFLTYKIFNTQEEAVTAYKLGEIDHFESTDLAMAQEFRNWRNTSVNKGIDYSRIVTLFINTQKAPFDNKNLRDAVSLGIDFGKLEKFGARSYSPISPLSWAYNDNLKALSYEPEIAASLVEKNSSDERKIVLYSSYDLNDLTEELNASLQEMGFKSEIRFTNYIPTEYDLYLTVWEPPIDPDQYVFWHQTQKVGNLSKLKSVRIDKVLEDGRKEISPTKRKQIYRKFQELIVEEVPAVFLIFPNKYTITRR